MESVMCTQAHENDDFTVGKDYEVIECNYDDDGVVDCVDVINDNGDRSFLLSEEFIETK